MKISGISGIIFPGSVLFGEFIFSTNFDFNSINLFGNDLLFKNPEGL